MEDPIVFCISKIEQILQKLGSSATLESVKDEMSKDKMFKDPCDTGMFDCEIEKKLVGKNKTKRRAK